MNIKKVFEVLAFKTKRGILNLKMALAPVGAFLGVYLLFTIVSNLIPDLRHAIHNITASLTDVPLIGALFNDGGIIYLILAVLIFAAGVFGIQRMVGTGSGK